MKFDVKQIKVEDLDGKPINAVNLDKAIGNILYQNTTTLDWLEKARAVHKGEVISVTKEDLSVLTYVVANANIVLAVKDAIVKYLSTIKEIPQPDNVTT